MLGVARIYQCHVSVHIIPRVSCAPVPLPIVLSCLMSPPPHKEKEKRKNACARSLREIRSSGWLGSLLWRKRASRRHQKKTKKKTTTTHPAASRTSHPHLHVHNRSNLRLKTEEKGRCGIFCVIVRCILVFFFHLQQPTDGGRSKPAARSGSQIFHAASPPSPPPSPPRASGYKNPQTPSLSGAGLN